MRLWLLVALVASSTDWLVPFAIGALVWQASRSQEPVISGSFQVGTLGGDVEVYVLLELLSLMLMSAMLMIQIVLVASVMRRQDGDNDCYAVDCGSDMNSLRSVWLANSRLCLHHKLTTRCQRDGNVLAT